MSENVKPPVWFWIVVVVALIWNLAGVTNYLMTVTMTAEALAALPEAERSLYEALPRWATASFAIAVWGGALGCIVLLVRKVFAYPILLISLIAILIQMFYNLFLSNMLEVYGVTGVILPLMVIPIGIFLVWFARFSKSKGWID